ncbi:MAG: PKD domain-containing protein, partial [bacterium]
AMFTANVVNFINAKPVNLGFHINSTPLGPDYADVDIDVSITHPFPGLPQYNGYDVRGVFMSDGSGYLDYNSDLAYPVLGTDQIMLADSDDGVGGADGYTRWFNKTEFSGGGMPLFQYTPGKAASPGFNGDATLNAYKYFADNLGKDENLWDWLIANADQHGVFSSGATNSRNYYLRFPNAKGVKYGYAIIANWGGLEPQYHPSNAPEAIACDVVDNSNVYYAGPTDKGGQINIDFSLFDWHGQPSSIFIESTVQSGIHQLDPTEMTPVAGDENYSTWHVEIPADNVSGTEGNYYWIIAEYSDFDYSNDFNVPNLAEDSPLAAFFRYDLEVSPSPTNQDPVCDFVVVTPMPTSGWDGGTPVEFDASGSYDPDGDPLEYSWDFDGDGIFGDPYDSGTDDNPTKLYKEDYVEDVCVKVSDGMGGESVCCEPVDVTAWPSKNIELRSDSKAVDIAIDHTNGDLLVLYEDKKIYKHHLNEGYQDGSLFIDIPACGHLPRIMYAIDIAPSRWIGISLTYVADDVPGYFVYDPDAVFNQYFGQAAPAGPMDSCAMAAGTYINDMGFVRGYDAYGTGYPYTVVLRGTLSGGYYGFGGLHYYNITDGIFTGIDRVYYKYVKGTESDGAGDFVWFLEDPDYYVSRWKLWEQGAYDNLSYDNAYFGTGAQTDSDTGWNDGKDLTRDNLNRYFVLDQLSTGQPRIKMWTVDGNTTESKGGFGDSSSINGAPLRIEGSDYDGDIVVLHGDTLPCMISVFVPSEMPG